MRFTVRRADASDRCMCRYEERLREYAESHLHSTNGVRRTPKGLTYVKEWGSLRHAAGAAGIVSLYGRSQLVKGNQAGAEMMEFAEQQVRSSLNSARSNELVVLIC
jgi:hypothetical protein